MNITINPFQQLYFSDDAQSENNFVDLFSKEVLQTAIHPVFQGGNVVLSGTQGCGKTMILSLLRPETRIAYWKQGEEFPVNEQMRNFISAGVNLTRSGIPELVQVTLHQGSEVDERELPYYFADFFNYFVVADLLKSLETIGENAEIFDTMVDLSRFDPFAKLVAEQDCWFGVLDGVKTIVQLKQRIAERVAFYRRWINGNWPDPLPPDAVRQSKTSIGEPIARAADCLRQSGMIGDDVPILIRVDQIEALHQGFTNRAHRLQLAFRKMLNCVFAARDARVHYRAGTRPYGWDKSFLSVWGSEARLEMRRNYLIVDMDTNLFIRGENTKDSIFEQFAVDTFQKRIQYYFQEEARGLEASISKRIFGKSPVAGKRLAQLNEKPSDRQIDRALGLDLAADRGQWTDEWRDFLRKMFRSGHEGMLNAVLAAAWGRQTGGGGHSSEQHRKSPPPSNAPWKDRQWWRKERLSQAVLQLSTRCQQRFMWWGFNDIRSLSGGNITIFLHICHRIWDGFLKDQSSLTPKKRTDLLRNGTIDYKIQSAGILTASNDWLGKLSEEPGGNSRQNFVDKLGTYLNHLMMNDLSMSYPGGNGVSVVLSEYESDNEAIPELRSFLNSAADYAVLLIRDHSSKAKMTGKRKKIYLHPILCPRFQLPGVRTKEPYYWGIADLLKFARKAQITLPQAVSPKPILDSQQGSLDFGDNPS